MSIDSTLRRKLEAILSPARVLTDPEDLIVYSYDGTWTENRPEAVVSALTSAEVSQVLALANALKMPVVPRGAGSGLAGGSVPANGGIVLNLASMDRILVVDTANMVAVVQPGVVNARLQAEVERRGLFYPPDPASFAQSTIGGNVATSASGPRCLKYGGTKDFVLGLEVVLASGEIIRTGGKMIKNVTGYNLTQLFVGSEGTLGVITEVTLRVIPLPKASATAMAVFPRLDDASLAVERILAAGIIPLALEMMDRGAVRCVEEYLHIGLPVDLEAVLLVEVDGEERVVSQQVEQVAEICSGAGATQVKRTAEAAESDRLWRARRAVGPALSRARPNKLGEDISVPRSAIPEMVRRIGLIAVRHELQIPLFGHIGDGNLHPNILCDLRDGEEMRRVKGAAEEIFAAAVELGGTLSGEHGIGLLKRDFLALDLSPAAIAVMKRIKSALDPHGILNPGKVFPPASLTEPRN
ncbi:MAG: FAD-linked oxidase C-terminal domain-containing protein [Dehalococcoidia bacterium]|nr:FAD-linked oxidase C-terminal domain-containing protein [Dehalococcoidia bacterium]